MADTVQTISPTEVDYYADHTTEALERIVASYTDQSLSIALGSGADHPLSIEAMQIANAAWFQIELREAGVS